MRGYTKQFKRTLLSCKIKHGVIDKTEIATGILDNAPGSYLDIVLWDETGTYPENELQEVIQKIEELKRGRKENANR